MSTPTTPPNEGGTSRDGETVMLVGGQDWDEVVAAASRRATRATASS